MTLRSRIAGGTSSWGHYADKLANGFTMEGSEGWAFITMCKMMVVLIAVGIEVSVSSTSKKQEVNPDEMVMPAYRRANGRSASTSGFRGTRRPRMRNWCIDTLINFTGVNIVYVDMWNIRAAPVTMEAGRVAAVRTVLSRLRHVKCRISIDAEEYVTLFITYCNDRSIGAVWVMRSGVSKDTVT